MTSSKNLKIFIDSEVICLQHFSGIGHYTAALLKEVDKLLDSPEFKHFDVTLGVPWRLAHRLNRFGFKNYGVTRMPLGPRVANKLKTYGLLPPIDLLYGRQAYVFPHFSTWPTLHSPSIPIIYDLSFVLHPEFSADLNTRFLVKQTRLAAERATKIITISQNSKAEIAEHYKVNPDDIVIVYPIIDKHAFYRRNANEIKAARAKYGIFGKYILFVGNIEPRKNLATLLRAYAMLDATQLKDYSLLLVGAKGWKDGEIHDLINDLQDKGLKVMQPNGYVTDEDMPALVSGASIFTYVSRYEGFGIPPVEAMFCGTPVISSDNSSLPEAVGDAALMVSAEDTKQISQAIEKLLRDPQLQQSLITAGKKHIQKTMFKPEQAARTFLEAVTEAVMTGGNNA
jgi:glycosyltransferase involved in cell wall biosynthesis